MKTLPLKFLFILFLLSSFLFFLKTPVNAQPSCEATRNPDQSCNYEDNCSPLHMRTWQTGKETTQCHCECKECTEDVHCENLGSNAYCDPIQFRCEQPGGDCINFDLHGGSNQPDVTCTNPELVPLIEPKYVLGSPEYYTCICVECINKNDCKDPEAECTIYHCESPPGEEEPYPIINPWCDKSQQGINTAIGCIPIDPSSLVQTVITFIIGLAGIIAFLLMVFAAIKIILAGGNPEKLQAGKEMFTSAIIGLILIIFSTVILELIGVHILQIPGFFE